MLQILVMIWLHLGLAADPTAEALCRDEISFRSCYALSHSDCIKLAEEAVQTCMAILPSHETLDFENMDSEVGKWNILLGHCAEEKFEVFHQNAFQETAECKDLLSKRKNHRVTNKPKLTFAVTKRYTPRKKVPQSPWLILGMVATPLFYGLSGAFLFLHSRFRKKIPITFKHGFISWIIFLFAGFVGELTSHILFQSMYASIGDNPGQVVGYMLTMLLSVIINPILWFIFKKKSH